MIAKYLDRPDIRTTLGVETPGNFSSCSSTVGAGFNAQLDKWNFPTQFYVASLLDRGIRVLIYAGTYDWQCNWVANKLWVDKLEWHGQAEYAALSWLNWTVDERVVGEFKATDLLTFATIRGAGHMMSLGSLLC